MESVRESLGKVAITIDKDCWDIDRNYPALHIVWVDSALKSYISRKPVPAGIPISDNEFWRPFSSLEEKVNINYNTFKRDYKGILISYSECVNGLQTQVNRLNTALDTGITFSGNKTKIKVPANGHDTVTLTLICPTGTQASAVELYKNGVLYQSYTNKSTLSVTISISDTTAFVVNATIDDVVYTGGWFVQNELP